MAATTVRRRLTEVERAERVEALTAELAAERSRASPADDRPLTRTAWPTAARPLVISVVARLVARNEVYAMVPAEHGDLRDVRGCT